MEKNNIWVKLFITLLVFAVIPVSAIGAGNSGKQKIEHIYQRGGDGEIAVYGDSAWSNPDNCQDSSRIVVAGDNPLRKEFYSAILTAKVTNADFQAYLVGCRDWSGVTYPLIWGVNSY